VRAFIAVFYPDCKFETTTVFGEVKPVETDVVLFRTSGRAILEEGWKIIYKKNTTEGTEEEEKVTDDNRSLPVFQKGENGSHIPSLIEKWTQPPKPYTEATLLRAMETAGKFVDNEELRDAMKENGIGRPSTRAAIIETLFKRRYIRKERKNLIATPTGVELIGIIREELLKSAELTGIWEKKLREIERRQYDAQVFISELKQMVADLINQVRSDNSNRHIAITTEEDLKKKTKKVAPANASNAPAGFQPSSRAGRSSKSGKSQSPKPKTMEEVKAEHNPDEVIGMPCPLCHEGHIVKGKAAYGCSRWKEGCTYRLPFDQA
jgi:DNA topoisomerase-3